MRSYIRHPSDIPIQVDVTSADSHSQHHLNDVSHGGLAFSMDSPVPVGTVIKLTIESVEPAFITEGLVTHCRQEGNGYVIGIEFVNKDDLFVARMVEQVCHIEHYKREVSSREGRQISGEEAAHEWIERYAATFPQWNH